jgi:hypothetical protein
METDMDTPLTPINKVLLIDLDNCPAEVTQLSENLSQFKRIIGCFGQQEPRIPLSLASVLATPLYQGMLELVKMPRSGKNAADFGLAFMAGRLLAEMPADTEFVILSQDGDLDHVVDMLCASDRKAERIAPTKNGNAQSSTAAKNSNTEVNSVNICDTEIENLAYHYWNLRLKNNSNRPATKKSLFNSINSSNRGLPAKKVQEILDCLERWKVFTMAKNAQNKITYTEKQPPYHD